MTPEKKREPEFRGTERFELRERLGAGGFGEVFEAFDRQNSANVALKVLHQADPAAVFRFKQEFRLLAELVHENLVTLYEFFSEGDRWFFTMELVPGEHIVDFLRDVGGVGGFSSALGAATETLPGRRKLAETVLTRSGAPDRTMTSVQRGSRPGSAPEDGEAEAGFECQRFALDAATLRRVFLELASGLVALHSAGVVHRDLKPSNVLVTPAGRVVILDFGLVKQIEQLRASNGVSSEPIAGSPPYMAPEQWTRRAISEASDWYAVGVILYEVLTGHRPFTGAPAAIMRAQQLGPLPISSLVEGAPPDLTALCEDLLRKTPEDRPTGEEVLARLGAQGSRGAVTAIHRTRLVGRSGELAALEEAFQRSLKGSPVIARVHGPGGVGKTALLRSFADKLRDTEAAVALSGRCYERESVPYKALDSLIDAVSYHLSRLSDSEVRALPPHQMHELARLFPVLKLNIGRFPDQGPVSTREADSRMVRARAGAYLRELFRHLGQARPLVLFIDDLQWGDVDSARLLAEVLSPPNAPPLLLVISYRSDEVLGNACLAELNKLFDSLPWAVPPTDVPVGPLSPEEALRLVLDRVESEGNLVDKAEGVARESGGNPLLVEEFVRYLESEGATAVIDLSLGHVIEARVQKLPVDARRLIELVAVAGHPIDQTVALAAARSATLSSIALLRSVHLLRTRTFGRRVEVEIRHDQIRHRLLAPIGESALRGHHARLAEVLEDTGDPSPDRLAFHLHGSGQLRRAAHFAFKAAERACGALAFARAAEHYGCALDWSRDAAAAEIPLRRTVERAQADMLALAGRGADAALIYVHLSTAASPNEKRDLVRLAFEQFLVSGRLDEGLALVRPALAHIGLRFPDSTPAAMLHLAWPLLRLKLRSLTFEERDEADVPPARLDRIDVCWSLGKAIADVKPMHATSFQLRSLLMALDEGEPVRVSRALIAFGGMWLWQGTPRALATGTRYLQRGAAIARRLSRPELAGMTEIFASARAVTVGDFDIALRLADEGVEQLRRFGREAGWEGNMARLMALLAAEALLSPNEIGVRAAGWFREAVNRGDLFSQVSATVGWALGRVAAGEPEDARTRLQGAFAAWSATVSVQRLTAVPVELYADLYDGRPDRAHRRVTDDWAELRQMLPAAIARIKLHTIRAQVAISLAAQDPQRRCALLKEAHKDATRVSRELRRDAAPIAEVLFAGVASVRGDAEQALARMTRANAAFEARGMKVHSAIAARKRGELLGGDEGSSLIALADRALVEEGVREPGRWAAVVAPGITPFAKSSGTPT